MKILHTVESYYPSVGGMQEVVKQLSEGLAKNGHQVTVATSKNGNRKSNRINGVKIVDFRIPEDSERYQHFVVSNRFDIMANFAAQQWASDLVFPVLDKVKAKKVFVPTGFSKLYSPNYKSYYQKMPDWMKEYDLNIFLSSNYKDITFARKYKIKNIKIIPNGASHEEFEHPLPKNTDKFLILLVGSHTGHKGHHEAIKIFQKAKIPNSELLILGDIVQNGCYHSCWLQSKLSRSIKLAHLSREETVRKFKQANLFLFPSNIECSPLVLFEAAAAKTPFLASKAGNSKEIASWTKGGLILPTTFDKAGFGYVDIDKSAKMLTALYLDENKRLKMGEAGHRNWLKRFTWEKIVDHYEKTYQKLKKG